MAIDYNDPNYYNSPEFIWQQISQNLDSPNTLANYLKTTGLTPDRVAEVLQATGKGGMAEVQDFVAKTPQLQSWASGGGQAAAQPAATAQPFGGATAGAPAQGPVANPYLTGGGGGLTLAPNPEGGYNTYKPPAAAAPTTQQTGVPGATQPNPYLPATGSSTQPMAGGGFNSYNGQSMQGTQGQRPMGQTQNPYMQQGGGGRGMGFDNPYTSWMADSIGQKLGQNLQRNLLPGIRSAASQAGGLGGSRQGIAEGVAIGDTMTGYGQALSGLYSGQYNQDRNYGLQSDALDLNVYNTNQNWMRQGQQDQIGLVDKMLGWNQGGLNTATQAADQRFNDWNKFVGPATQMGGLGGTNTQNMQGNPYLGALGGAMTGYNLYQNWGK